MYMQRQAWASVLPGAELTEGLEGGGAHVAESGVVAHQQEGQHLKPQRHNHKRALLLTTTLQSDNQEHNAEEIHLSFHVKIRRGDMKR